MAFTKVHDETKPDGSIRAAALLDNDIKEAKVVERERQAVDHNRKADETGDDYIGYHKKVSFIDQESDPATYTQGGVIFTKSGEVYIRDKAGNVIQITSGGKLLAALLTGNQTIAGVKTFSSFPVGPSTAPTTDYQFANKKYADDLTPAGAAGGDLAGTYPNPTIGASKVLTTSLKTSMTTVNTAVAANLTLPGGEYGFYPQVKMAADGIDAVTAQIVSALVGTSYVTNIYLSMNSGTAYARQRYVTASGRDHWVFLLYDKVAKKIMASYEAPDHPAYGNGDDETIVPHPFADYHNKPLSANLEIILVDNDEVKKIKERKTKKKGILEIVSDEYEVGEEVSYKPRDIADEEGNHRLINALPGYIKVKKLKKK